MNTRSPLRQQVGVKLSHQLQYDTWTHIHTGSMDVNSVRGGQNFGIVNLLDEAVRLETLVGEIENVIARS